MAPGTNRKCRSRESVGRTDFPCFCFVGKQAIPAGFGAKQLRDQGESAVVSGGADLDQLGGDADGDLGGGLGADVKAYGGGNAG